MNSQDKIDLSILLHSDIKRAIHNNRPSPLSYKEKRVCYGHQKGKVRNFLYQLLKRSTYVFSDFRNQNFMVTWSTNLRNLKEGMFFSFQFRKIITRYRRICYNLNVMQQSACLVFNPIIVDSYAALPS